MRKSANTVFRGALVRFSHKKSQHSPESEKIWHHCDNENCDYKTLQKRHVTRHKKSQHSLESEKIWHQDRHTMLVA